MLNDREKQPREKGSGLDTSGSNTHYRTYIQDKPHAAPPMTRKASEPAVPMTKDEARQMLAEAYAKPHPPVTVCPVGLPDGPTNLANCSSADGKARRAKAAAKW